jgi:hypothetical protein
MQRDGFMFAITCLWDGPNIIRQRSQAVGVIVNVLPNRVLVHNDLRYNMIKAYAFGNLFFKHILW